MTVSGGTIIKASSNVLTSAWRNTGSRTRRA